jgi:hypothetical protein
MGKRNRVTVTNTFATFSRLTRPPETRFFEKTWFLRSLCLWDVEGSMGKRNRVTITKPGFWFGDVSNQLTSPVRGDGKKPGFLKKPGFWLVTSRFWEWGESFAINCDRPFLTAPFLCWFAAWVGEGIISARGVSFLYVAEASYSARVAFHIFHKSDVCFLCGT